MINCLMVGLGGFTGAVIRYLMTGIAIEKMDFPYMTLLINIIGSFIIGIVVALSVKSNMLNESWMLFLKVGLCGGFTTFSSFALETQELFSSGNNFFGIAYILLSVTFCIFAVALGQTVVEGLSIIFVMED